MSERALNLPAAARIARRVQLSDVYVAELSAKRPDSPPTTLTPELTDTYEVHRIADKLQVLCRHRLQLQQATEDNHAAEIDVALHLIYDIIGSDPVNEDDLSAFANANGAYHSWPFIREIYNSMTLRLGLPAFVLPTLLVVSPAPKPPPPPPPTAPTESAEGAEEKKGDETSI